MLLNYLSILLLISVIVFVIFVTVISFWNVIFKLKVHLDKLPWYLVGHQGAIMLEEPHR